MGSPRVCVALSVRDGERYLEEAIESVLSQDGVDLELRIYDNGSTDRSLELARRYAADPRVTVAENPYGTTYYGSLNRALEETSAEYFAAFACDDLMRPGNLSEKVDALERTGAIFAHSQAEVIDGDGVVQRVWCDHAGAPPLAGTGEFFGHMAPVNTMVLMAAICRTDALRAIGGFDVRLEYCCDWLALLRLTLRGPVATIHRPLVGYRRHEGAGSNFWHSGASWVGQLVTALCLTVADTEFPGEWQASVPALFAGCLVHCARELASAEVHRTDPSGLTAYACAARASELVPGDARLRDLFLHLLALAGFGQAAALPRPLVGAVPETPFEAARLLERCDSLVAAGLGSVVRIGCSGSALERVAALLEEGCARRPALDVILVQTVDPGELLEPGTIAVIPAGRSAAIEELEARGVPVLAFDVPGPLGGPWDRELEASLPAAASSGTLQDPSPALTAFAADFPWERGTILSFIQRSAASLPAGTWVLDVGAGDAPYRELFAHTEYFTTDWEKSVHPGARGADYIGSADDLPIPDQSFEAVINTQVLEHVADPLAVLREIHRVLVPGGRFFLTVPLVWELHEEPYDFFRYTPHGLAHLLSQAGFVDVAIAPRNDCFTTIAQLMRNVAAAMGSRDDGLNAQRAQAARTMAELAGMVAEFAPLDARRILPLGYEVTAARTGAAVLQAGAREREAVAS